MAEQEKLERAIRVLEGNYRNFVLRYNRELVTVNEILALLKAQEPEKEKIPEYPCKNCCSPSERAFCCGCEKERQWQTKYGKQQGQ